MRRATAGSLIVHMTIEIEEIDRSDRFTFRAVKVVVIKYNCDNRATELLAAAGERVVYASDAGTPAVSDPGARLVAAVRAAGYRVVPIPGASSVTAALSAAGAGGEDGAFVFAGFLPAKAAERQSAVAALAGEARAVVLLEAPHRIEALAQALSPLAARSRARAN